jgi:ribA/ribD-fused uncharacterized protein
MIGEFKGEYRWLSNFATCCITFNGIIYLSVEHAYMSAKSDDPEWKEYCRIEPQAGNVKRRSKSINLVDFWDIKKTLVMKELLMIKFSIDPFNRLLLSTGDQEIQEGNTWGDTFWGVDLNTGIGENMLGKMIMEIRCHIRKCYELHAVGVNYGSLDGLIGF